MSTKEKVLIGIVCVLGFALLAETNYLLDAQKAHERRLKALERMQPRYATGAHPLKTAKVKDPIDDVETMLRRMNRMFRDLSDDFSKTWPEVSAPKEEAFAVVLDVAQTPQEYIVRADIPGMDKGDIRIDAKGNVLTISGERKNETEVNKEGFYRAERSFGSFSKTVMLPQEIKPERIKAEYKNGVLLVKVPKDKPEKPLETKVPIQ